MIFVAVGTQKFQFNRLLKKIDELIFLGIIEDNVYAQIGYSDYKPKNYKYEQFLSNEEFEEYIKCCDLLITHSGVATIMKGINSRKPVIVVPRLKRFDEHVDDHQIQIAESFTKQNLVMMCNSLNDLKDLIYCIKSHEFTKYVSNREQVIKVIKDYLNII